MIRFNQSHIDFLAINEGKMDLHLYDAVSHELYTDIYLSCFVLIDSCSRNCT